MPSKHRLLHLLPLKHLQNIVFVSASLIYLQHIAIYICFPEMPSKHRLLHPLLWTTFVTSSLCILLWNAFTTSSLYLLLWYAFKHHSNSCFIWFASSSELITIPLISVNVLAFTNPHHLKVRRTGRDAVRWCRVVAWLCFSVNSSCDRGTRQRPDAWMRCYKMSGASMNVLNNS